MISRILPAVITIALLSSCSTAYRAQTPDDVYYSPARPQEEYVRVETQKERDQYNHQDENVDDRYLRWKVRNRSRWGGFDDYSYDWYDYRYAYNTYTWNRPNYWHNYWSWNSGYNPYCGRVIIVNPKTPVYNSVVRTYRPGTYNTNYNNSNNTNGKFKTNPGTYRSTGTYNNGNSNSNSLGSSIKKVFSNSNDNSNNSSSDRPTRTYTPPTNNSSSNSSSSGSSSGGSSGGSGGGVSRPSRGG